jgi:hypothetical protein
MKQLTGDGGAKSEVIAASPARDRRVQDNRHSKNDSVEQKDGGNQKKKKGRRARRTKKKKESEGGIEGQRCDEGELEEEEDEEEDGSLLVKAVHRYGTIENDSYGESTSMGNCYESRHESGNATHTDNPTRNGGSCSGNVDNSSSCSSGNYRGSHYSNSSSDSNGNYYLGNKDLKASTVSDANSTGISSSSYSPTRPLIDLSLAQVLADLNRTRELSKRGALSLHQLHQSNPLQSPTKGALGSAFFDPLSSTEEKGRFKVQDPRYGAPRRVEALPQFHLCCE